MQKTMKRDVSGMVPERPTDQNDLRIRLAVPEVKGKQEERRQHLSVIRHAA